MDTEEMYRRGAEDAERGEPHPFFYQHYYHYRRGYDHARRRLSLAPGNLRALLWPASAVAIVLAIGGALWALLQNQQPVAEPVASTAIVAVVPTAALPTRTPIFPTATVLPTATPVVLRAGGLARVAGTGGRPLRGREEPSLDAPARVAFAEGEQVRVLEGPIEADGYVWWRIEGPSGAAWSAQGSPEGAEWLVPVVE